MQSNPAQPSEPVEQPKGKNEWKYVLRMAQSMRRARLRVNTMGRNLIEEVLAKK